MIFHSPYPDKPIPTQTFSAFVLERAADLFAHKVGVVCSGREFTYGEFARRARCLATGLEAAGLRAGDRVGFISFNTHRLLEGYFGVVQARCIVMPLNVRLSPSEIAAILRHSGARFLFYEADFLPIVEAVRGECPEVEHWLELVEVGEEI